MPDATNSIGAVLKIGVTTVGKITKINVPEMSKAEIDVTTLESTGGYKEFISDFRDSGSLSFEGFADSDSGQDALKTNYDGDTNEEFTIELPNGMTINFEGYVSKFKKGDAAVGQALGFSGEIRVSGELEFSETDSTGCSAITVTQAGGTPLTGAAWAPAFSISKYAFTFSFNTQTSFVVTATNATANTTILLYVDGVYTEELATTVESAAISIDAAKAKLIEVKTYQTDKKPLIYSIMVARTA